MLELKTSHLKAALTHAAKSDPRYYLNGVCLTVGEHGMAYLMATDGGRAFIGSFVANWTDGEQKGPFQIIIPRDTVNAPTLTLEPMETESERHARLIETANRRALTPEQVADHIVRRKA